MADLDPLSVFDASRASGSRSVMTTGLDTAGLRDLGADVLARSVFTARGTNVIFVSKIAEVVDAIVAGNMDEASGRLALLETIRATGYTPEGGFPDAPPGSVPPAVAGSLQDLSSFRRLDLIIRTQVDLMAGAGQQRRGQQPERLATFPAGELIRIEQRQVPRVWSARWQIAGRELLDGRMIALKGDPFWGDLGSFDIFPDALGVDHPPFAFLSGMGWREVSAAEVKALGIKGPNGESPAEFHKTNPITITGKVPLPAPQISMEDVRPDLVDAFKESTHATPRPEKPAVMDYSDLLAAEIAKHDAAYKKGSTR